MSLFIIVIITGVVLANVYEKEIKQYAIDEINSHLKAKIKINEDNISFSFFKKFPKASLNFADLLIEDENQKDTIVFAENFSLEFGLGSLFSGNYEVNEVGIDDAVFNLKVDEKGNENYIFWKESTNKDTTENDLGFKLNEVNFNDVALNYENIKLGSQANVYLNETSFSGDFSSDSSILTIDSDLLINQISSDSNVYFANKPSKLMVERSKFTTSEIVLDNGKVTIGEMTLDFNSFFDNNAILS